MTFSTINSVSSLRKQATGCISSERFGNAVFLLKEARSIEPDNADIHKDLAQCYIRLGQLTEAIACANKALKLNPGCVEAWCFKGMAFSFQKKFGEAEAAVEEALHLQPDFFLAFYVLANIKHQNNALLAAVALYRKCIRIDASFATAYNDLGVALLNLGYVDQARESLEAALQLKPEYPSCFLNLGLSLTRQGKMEEAIEAYKRAIELSANYADAHYNLANLFASQARLTEAREHYESAIKINPAHSLAHLNLGLVHQREGDLVEAKKAFEKALEVNPANLQAKALLDTINGGNGKPDTGSLILPEMRAVSKAALDADGHNKEGNRLHQQGNYKEAIVQYQECLKLVPNHVQALSDLGVALRELKRPEEALRYIDKALSLDPNHLGALLNKGVCLTDLSRDEECMDCYLKLLAINPDYGRAHLNIGIQYLKQDLVDEAIRHLERANELLSGTPSIHLNLGLAYKKKGDVQEAINNYRKSIELNPRFKEAHLNLGVLLHDLGRLGESIRSYDCALEVDPKFAEAHNNKGFALNELGRYSDAADCLKKAIAINPGLADAYFNLVYSHYRLDNLDEALATCHRMIAVKPDHAPAHDCLGFQYTEQGRVDEAIGALHKALELRTPNAGEESLVRKLGRLLIELKRLPINYEEESAIQSYRDRFRNNLSEALSLVSQINPELSKEDRSILRNIVFNVSNFYVAYQQFNDVEVQKDYSLLVTKLLDAELAPYLKLERTRKPGAKIRFGIASRYIGVHNGASWAYDWMANLPREDYEFFLYSLNGISDSHTQKFASLGTFKWLPFTDENFKLALDTISGDNLDVLLIPDVGMTPSSRIISLARLAAVQCVAWGHPVTSGSPTIDYYLSSELMEPADADEHYSEKLIRLPNIGLHFSEVPAPAPGSVTRQEFDLPENRTIYGSVQSLFKYLPQFDFLYAEIAKKVPDALFVFVSNKSQSVTDIFRRRLEKSFDAAGLNFEQYVRIMPRMTVDDFMRFLSVLDVNLDSVGWTGGLTSMRAITVNLPTVTIPGQFMRGRHSYAMLKMIGMEELIVNSLDEYIQLAARLGQDRELRTSIGEKLGQQKSRLFKDMQCVEELDKLLKAAVVKHEGE